MDAHKVGREETTGTAPGIAVLAPFPGQAPFGAHRGPTPLSSHTHTRDISSYVGKIFEKSKENEHTKSSSTTVIWCVRALRVLNFHDLSWTVESS